MGNLFTRILFGARWILAPVYLGLSASLIDLAYKFLVELYEKVLNVAHYNNEEITLMPAITYQLRSERGIAFMMIYPVMKTLSRV